MFAILLLSCSLSSRLSSRTLILITASIYPAVVGTSGSCYEKLFPSASQVLLSRVQGEASAARIPAKAAGFVSPSLPEEKPFLEAAELSCPAQSLGPPAALAPLPQLQCLPLVVPSCAPHGYQAEMPLTNTGQAKAMWSFFLGELAVPTASLCTLLPTPPNTY